eukprot:5128306-Amphidinium_carterae.1
MAYVGTVVSRQQAVTLSKLAQGRQRGHIHDDRDNGKVINCASRSWLGSCWLWSASLKSLHFFMRGTPYEVSHP